MSKFLKIIVNLVVLVSIAIAAALLVPPFIGIDTVMNDNTEMETNIPVGSVAYGQRVKITELKKGDKIIENDGASTYIYEITDMDASAGVYRVKDVYNKKSDGIEITLQKTAPKVMVVVPLIGYAAIALQSKEGLIVIGLGIVFLIILFILSELFRKDDDDDEDDDDEYEDEDDDDEDEDDEEEEKLSRKERKRLKKEEKRRRKEEKRRRKEEEYEYEDDEDEDEDDEEEEELSRKERRRLKKEEKRRRKLAKKGLLDEDEDEDEDEEDEDENKPSESLTENPSSSNELQGFDDAMKEAMSSIAMGIAQVSEPETVSDATVVMPDVQAFEKTVENTSSDDADIAAEDMDEMEVKETEEPINIEETEAVPFDPEVVLHAPTVKELLEKAQVAGEKPEIKKDKDNDVTLLDYSDIL